MSFLEENLVWETIIESSVGLVFSFFLFFFLYFFKGGPVGDPETGAGQVCQQVSRDVERREQAQAVHCHCPDWRPSCAFPGKMQFHHYVTVQLEYDMTC